MKEVQRHNRGKSVQTESSRREKLRGGRMPRMVRGQQADQRGCSGRAKRERRRGSSQIWNRRAGHAMLKLFPREQGAKAGIRMR